MPLRIQHASNHKLPDRDYIILVDAGFKLTPDIMFTIPFPHNSKMIVSFAKSLTPMFHTTDNVYRKQSRYER
jgi:hypothetical protein